MDGGDVAEGDNDPSGGPEDPGPDALLGAPLDDLEYDTPADVEATFRTERRIAVGYFVVFLLVTFAVPLMSILLPWWTGARIAGGMSPAFLMTAVGLYVFFLVIGVLAATLADNVEERMLGVHDTGDDR